MRTNTPQYKHLKSRISVAASQFSWWRVERRSKRKEPPEVRRARAVVRKYERAKASVQKKYEARIDKLREKADEALMFKEDKAALAAVIRFEKAAAKLVATLHGRK